MIYFSKIHAIYILQTQNQLNLVVLNLSAQGMCNLKGMAIEAPNSSFKILL